MIEQLETVQGINLIINVKDNTASAIQESKNLTVEWLGYFEDYKVIIQPVYQFEQYGSQMAGIQHFPLSCFSEQFYRQWYGNLSEVLNKYDNIQCLIGFNEPYVHFENKSDAVTVMKREYNIWKDLSDIPFACELSLRNALWEDNDVNVEGDFSPIWEDYSDFISLNCWPDPAPISEYYDPIVWVRINQTMSVGNNYSDQIGKPILITETPSWHAEMLKQLYRGTEEIVIYQLWDVINGKETNEYSLWIVNHDTDATRKTLAFEVFSSTFPIENMERDQTSWYEKHFALFTVSVFIVFGMVLAIFVKKRLERDSF